MDPLGHLRNKFQSPLAEINTVVGYTRYRDKNIKKLQQMISEVYQSRFYRYVPGSAIDTLLCVGN
jgi:hypothetical protein